MAAVHPCTIITSPLVLLLLAYGSIMNCAVKASKAELQEGADGTVLLQAKHPQVQVAQDPDSLKWRETALDQQLSKVHKPSGSCGWVVHYDRWITTFDKGEFEHNDALGGAHCLDACCEDPSCAGLALESSEKYQCYKYSSVPAQLDETKAVRLGNAEWILRKPQAWSIFIKAKPGSELWLAAKPAPLPEPDARDARIEAVLEGLGMTPLTPEGEADLHSTAIAVVPESTGPRKNCDWDVYYDVWLPSFDQQEYEHNDAYGGKHCLEACCQDPTCEGLSLESNEMFQCYKYSALPPALEGDAKGLAKEMSIPPKRLGDGNWLLEKPSRWSVFAKRVVASPGLQVTAAEEIDAQQASLEPRALPVEKASEQLAARSPGVPTGVTPPQESAGKPTHMTRMQTVRTMLANHAVSHYWSVGALATVAVVALYFFSISDKRSARQLIYSLGGSTELKMLLKK